MRTDKELLQIALDNFDKYFNIGLCGLFWELLERKLITLDEWFSLKVLLETNAKKGTIKNKLLHPKELVVTSKDLSWPNFYWEKGLIEPRRAFLQYLLKNI